MRPSLKKTTKICFSTMQLVVHRSCSKSLTLHYLISQNIRIVLTTTYFTGMKTEGRKVNCPEAHWQDKSLNLSKEFIICNFPPKGTSKTLHY